MRLSLLCHAPTAALRAAAFPLDEPIDVGGRTAALALRGAVPAADRILTSPARHASDTAAALGLAAEPCPALADADNGRWAGRTLDAVAAAEPAAVGSWLGDPDAAPHGGESLAALLGRTAAWLDALAPPAGARRHRVLAVTHAAVIRALVVHALGAPPAAFWRIDVLPLSLTVLNGEGRRWTLARLGAPPGG